MDEVEQSQQGMQLISLFPTPLFVHKMPDLILCDQLVDSILKLKKESGKSADNFVSDDNLQTHEEFQEIANIFTQTSNTVLDFLKVKRTSHYISCMWANVTPPNHQHMLHLHPNSLLSGIMYLKTPDNCAGTVFADPRPAARVFEPSYTEISEFTSGAITFPATKGTMLIWPSWMPHGVDRGTTIDETEQRIVIAFNIYITGNIETKTAKLELK